MTVSNTRSSRRSRSSSNSPATSNESDVPNLDGVDKDVHFHLQGCSELPPIIIEDRPLIQPEGKTQWLEIPTVGKGRRPASVLSCLLKNYPGIVQYKGKSVIATTWNHYKADKDTNGRSKADVVEEGPYMNALAVDRMENGLHLMGWLMIARPWLRRSTSSTANKRQCQEEDDHERARLIEDARIAKEYARVLEWSSGQDNYNNSIKLILECVIQHTGMPLPVAISHLPPPPPPPTYGVYHSADQSTVNARSSGSVVGAREENHAGTAAVGAGEENHGGIAAREENNGGIGVSEENPEETLARISLGMFGGHVNASGSAGGNYSPPLEELGPF